MLFIEEPGLVANRRPQSHEEVLGGRLAATTSFTINRMGKQQEEKLIGGFCLFFCTKLTFTGCLCHDDRNNLVSSVFSLLSPELLKSFSFFSHSLGHIPNLIKQLKNKEKHDKKLKRIFVASTELVFTL